MLWMLLGCALLFLFLFLAGNVVPVKILWPVLIGVCVVMHIWMMRRHGSHTQHGEQATKAGVDEQKENTGHSGGCCSPKTK